MKGVAIGVAAGLSILAVAYSINRIAPVGTTGAKAKPVVQKVAQPQSQPQSQPQPMEPPRRPLGMGQQYVTRCNGMERTRGRCV